MNPSRSPVSRPTLRVRAPMSRVDTGGAPTPTGPKALTSATLLQGQVTVNIHHNGECYQLRMTRAGKLILTK
jgi:hemin uptake protein HemP